MKIIKHVIFGAENENEFWSASTTHGITRHAIAMSRTRFWHLVLWGEKHASQCCVEALPAILQGYLWSPTLALTTAIIGSNSDTIREPTLINGTLPETEQRVGLHQTSLVAI